MGSGEDNFPRGYSSILKRGRKKKSPILEILFRIPYLIIPYSKSLVIPINAYDIHGKLET